MRIRHILVPTDLSDSSRAGLAHGATIARASGARLTVLHVDELTQRLPDLDGVDAIRALARRARQRWMKAASVELEAMGVDVATRTVVGETVDAVDAFAASHDVDLIVLARRGIRSAHGLRIGSSTLGLLRRTEVPAMVVDGTEDLDGPIAPPPLYRRILVTTDFGPASHRGLKATLEIATAIEAEVLLVHVLTLPALPLLSLDESGMVTEALGPLTAQRRDALTAQALSLEGPARARPIATHLVVDTCAARGVVEAADRLGADLIVIPAHGKGSIRRTVLGSVAEQVVQLAAPPVLVLPAASLYRSAVIRRPESLEAARP